MEIRESIVEDRNKSIEIDQAPKGTALPGVLMLILAALLPFVLIILWIFLSYLIFINIENWLFPGLGVMNYALTALLMLIGFALVFLSLLTPAVFGFVFNLVRPTFTSWERALLSSGVFFLTTFLTLTVLLIYIYNISTELPPLNLRIIMLGLLFGIGLSGSLGLFGFWGASIRKKDRKVYP
jgi:hypothetical protein